MIRISTVFSDAIIKKKKNRLAEERAVCRLLNTVIGKMHLQQPELADNARIYLRQRFEPAERAASVFWREQINLM